MAKKGAPPKTGKKNGASANLGFEEKLWAAADKLRGHMDAAEYKHVVLGLVFLKYISDAFQELHDKLAADKHADAEDRDEYTAENVFWVPKAARWSYLQAQAKQPTIGKLIDDAMTAIEKDNPSLKGVLAKDYGRASLDKQRLGELIDLIGTIGLGDAESRSKDVLGRVYEYFLGKFANAEGTRILRRWRKEGLRIPRKKRKRRALGASKASVLARPAQAPHDVWCWDFTFDRTTAGSPLKWLSIVDEFTRECLCLKVDRGITSEAVIDWLAELLAMRGVPKCIRSDNGPEFIARAIRTWLSRVGVETLYVEPGSPWQNGYAESFHGRLRDEFLAVEEFESLAAARKLTAAWRDDYNLRRPHGSLGYQTPAEFAARCCSSVRPTASLQNSSGFNPRPS